jgi:hypothetical protein
LSKQGKSKKQMTREQKQAVLTRKEKVTKARKDKNRVPQEIAASRNRISPEAAPWAVAKARRAAVRHGVAGAA